MSHQMRSLKRSRKLSRKSTPSDKGSTNSRASQNAKVCRNFAPQGSFASFFKVIFRSGLLFPIQDRLTVPGKAGRFT